MDINDLTIGQVKEVSAMCGAQSAKITPFKVGHKYIFRLVTHYWTGCVHKITGDFLELTDAAWIPDTGRYGETITTGQVSECEPVGSAIINTGALIDAAGWPHELPMVQK